MKSIDKAARARAQDTTSRTLLIEAIKVASSIAADTDLPATARTRGIAEVRMLAKQLDELDAEDRQTAIPWRGALGVGAITAV